MTPSQHVAGMLVNVLEPKDKGRSSKLTPLPGEPNTFLAILDWEKKYDIVLAPTIYSLTGGVMHKITTVGMAQVMDFPVCCTEQLDETDVRLLIDDNSLGKDIQAAIFFFSRWNLTIKALTLVKRSMEDSEGQPIQNNQGC